VSPKSVPSRTRRPRWAVTTDVADADAVEWAKATLRSDGLQAVRADVIGNGTEAVVYRLSSSTNGSIIDHALKVFRRERKHNSVESIRAEFDVLKGFAATLAAHPCGVVCPHPLDVSPDGYAYLMTYVEGETLDDYLLRIRNGSVTDPADVVTAIVQGITRFYDAVGAPYADFQPRNVRVTTSAVALFDPMIGNPGFLPPRSGLQWWPPSADFGFWIQEVGADAVRQSVQRPRLVRARIDFTRRLVAAAAAAFAPRSQDRFRDEVVAVGDFHFQRYRRRLGIRWAAHHFVGRRVARQCAY
jgi:tRNA A-37 threonylcarbamoyl transferase component Bud32